jgi:hypothetical protein
MMLVVAAMDSKSFDKQSLRLVEAFFSLRDPQVREIIVKLVEDTAAGATVSGQTLDDLGSARIDGAH